MRVLILSCLLLLPTLVFANVKFVNPMTFDGSEAQKEQVINYITENVKKNYCDGSLDMCQDSLLRMMEKQELESFKEATQATDKKIMGNVIKSYCGDDIGMCNYSVIIMMYKENLKASKQKLEW
ncbi:hypothetical protein [Edwardsiella tarda]|uniref:hypothetical protein n=1 Tax=Edwardsiella tarda TaxID=636 RepID=UPI003A8747AF